jgi:branched-chain amino acid transport system substrate-binding protein
MHGFDLQLLPVTHPGVEQKATWLQIRQQRPDYVFLWGWGVMNSTALKEAQATGYPRDKMYGVWWAGAEPDVKDVGDGAKGYNALALQHGAEPNSKVVKDVLALVHDKGQGTGPRDEVGQVLYMRGLMSAMLGVEGVRRAQERFGKGKVMTGEQARWGLENLSLDQAKLDALGFNGVMRPISTSCADHRGSTWARIHTWDGSKWNFSSDWYQSDETIIKPMIKAPPTSTRRRRRSRAATPRTARPDPAAHRTAPPCGGPHRGLVPAPRAALRTSRKATMSNILLNVNGIEVIYNHVILVLKGVSLQVPEAASSRCWAATAPARRPRCAR